jgi:hypothetical protein
MSESGRLSETSESVDEDYSDYSEDSEYTESVEDSADEDYDGEHEAPPAPDDYSDVERSPGLVQRKKMAAGGEPTLVDSFYNEQKGRVKPRSEAPPDYPPDRWPPLLDFLFVFSSFVAAVIAAYFTLF